MGAVLCVFAAWRENHCAMLVWKGYGLEMRILITGASGSGTTTLGKATASELGWNLVDADGYFWMPTSPPFQEKRDPALRLRLILDALGQHESSVVSGSVMGWGEELEDCFDLIVFLYLDESVRLERLKAREEKRLGEIDLEFLEWASRYDDPDFDGRSLARHREWLSERECQVLSIEGDLTVEERSDRVCKALDDAAKKRMFQDSGEMSIDEERGDPQSRALFKLTVTIILMTVILPGLYIFLEWYNVSSFRSESDIIIYSLLLIWPPSVAGAFFGVPVASLLCISGQIRPFAARILAGSVVYLFIGIAAAAFVYEVRTNAYARLAERSEPLVGAIHQFVEDKRKPPGTLQELVPDYLPEVPGTDMPVYPEYGYSTEPSRWHDNSWSLYVRSPSGFMSFDIFVYFPDLDYPPPGEQPGRFYRRIGDWAYLSE